jgi:uncharacterized protein YgiM (DUF1202 family)
MNRIKHLAAALTALVLLLTAAPQAWAAPGDFAIVTNTSYLNMRAGPGMGYERVGSVSRNGWVEIISRTNADWYQCRDVGSGTVGYMSTGFLKEASGGGAGSTAVVNNPVPTQFLNLRVSPSYTAPVIGIFYNGTPVNVLSESGGWCYVLVNGLYGYFRIEFLSFSGGGAAGTATVYSSNGGRVNMRSGPSYTYSVLTQLSPGTVVTVLMKGAMFWQISTGGTMGFMESSFLRTGKDPSPPPSPGGSANATVKASARLNLREQTSTSSRVLGQYPGGTAVQVRAQGTQWCAVTVPSTGAKGYMMTRYLTLRGMPEVPTKIVRNPSGSYVNLRSAPSKHAGGVRVRVPHNSIVTIIAPGNEWTQVQYGKTKGYMMTYFLKTF